MTDPAPAAHGAAAGAAAAQADGVEVRDHPQFGRCAFATCAFKPGDIVVAEPPLLVCSDAGDGDQAAPAALADPAGAWLTQLIADNPAAAVAACGGNADDDNIQYLRKACVCYLAFCGADAAARAGVMDGMLNSVGEDAEGSDVVQRARLTARFISQVLAPRAKADGHLKGAPADAAAVERVLLAFELNAHAVDGRGALFAVNSKFTHTCGQPNAVFKSCGGMGYHVALRDIAEGDLLTTTYLEGGPMLMATAYRDVFTMEGFGFHCRCPRCVAPADDMRCVPCPRCATAATARGQDGLLPKAVALGLKGVRPPGVLTYTAAPTAADGGADGAPAAAAEGTWVCGTCGVALPDRDDEVFAPVGDRLAEIAGLAPSGRVERGVSALVHQADRDMAAGRASAVAVARLMELVSRAVGPDHWATHAMLRGHSEMLLAELQAAAASPAGAGTAISSLLDALQANWRLRVAWVDSRQGLEASHALFQEAQEHARKLYEAYPQMANALGGAHPASKRLAAVASWLRGVLAPAMRVFKDVWPLPEPLEMAAALEAAAARAAAAGASLACEDATAGSGGGGGWTAGAEGPSMQQLLDFLPAGSSSGSKAGKSKKKKSGSKR